MDARRESVVLEGVDRARGRHDARLRRTFAVRIGAEPRTLGIR